MQKPIYQITNDRQYIKKPMQKPIYQITDAGNVKQINLDAKNTANTLKLDKIEKMAEKEAFLTLQDHTPNFYNNPKCRPINRGVVEDTVMARGQGQGHKKIRGQGQPFRGQTLSRPRTGMLEAKDQGHKRKCSPKKKKGLHKNFSSDLHEKKRFPKNFSNAPQNFNNSKNSAVLEPRTDQFSRT